MKWNSYKWENKAETEKNKPKQLRNNMQEKGDKKSSTCGVFKEKPNSADSQTLSGRISLEFVAT